MHLLARDTRSLDEAEPAIDLGHAPADLLFLSFSDSDLAAMAAAWASLPAGRPSLPAGRPSLPAGRPSLQLANLARLRHPMSVDLYAETVAQARCVVVRLLGGLDYWRYGAEEFLAVCARAGIPFVLLPGDGRADDRLAAVSSVPAATWQRMDAFLRQGGPDNTAHALALATHLAGLGPDDGAQPIVLPNGGLHPLPGIPAEGVLRAAIVFYRSHLLSADLDPITALAAALAGRGMAVQAFYVSSLKNPDAARDVARWLAAYRPAVVLNATAFSARGDAGSPLDAAGVPVLQVVLTVGGRDGWAASSRGLSATDLAMQVVLPELDGRLLTTAISFKAAQETMPGLDFARSINRAEPDGIALAADRAAGWARLAATPRAARRVAIVLSDYPGASGQVAHAVGLDSFASLHSITALLHAAGYDVPGAVDWVRLIVHTVPAPFLSLAEYRRLFATLPEAVQSRVIAAWGDAAHDPALQAGNFSLRHASAGRLVVAVQPDRGSAADRKAGYHDPDLPPRHAFVAFYLWLRAGLAIDAMVHLGAHGTLEWLPGKAAALSAACFPAALLGGLPVIYPFIVNNPGEAAAAKRRLGAVTIGHLTPPLTEAGSHGAARALERLIDDYAAADGLDPRRTSLLRRDILAQADAAGLLAESGVLPDMPEADALARLDAYLCDVKDLQIRDGLHVFGMPPEAVRADTLLAALCRASPGMAEADLRARLDACATAERAALLAALDGAFVPPGPAGAPSRGRADVLPTGRNLASIDPRGVPTRTAFTLAGKAAEAVLLRHRQEQGDWPRSLVLDLWGSTTLRTGGEDFALALVLLGARPVWDEGSGRVSGIEILPIALLDRPRVDVTLRISGLFRDAFAAQIALFNAAVAAVAARDEAADWNPLAALPAGARVFGPAPGTYGTGLALLLGTGEAADSAAPGAAYLTGSGFAYGAANEDGAGEGVADAAGFAARVAGAAAFVHIQDHRETDLLDSPDYAAHEGGFAAAARTLGATPALYHTDTSQPDRPRARSLAEEIARVVRGRAANPVWLAGMMRHGYRGAAEIARTLDSLCGFAATLPDRLDAQFDLLFNATLGDPAVDAFLRDANPEARAAMQARFDQARAQGLWRARRNAVSVLERTAP